MWLFILLIILILFTGLAIILCRGDIMEPLSLSFEAFTLSALIAFSYNGLSGYDISAFTVCFIVTALFVYMIGYLILKAILRGIGIRQHFRKRRVFSFPKKMFSLVIFVIELMIVFRTFRSTLLIARGISASAGLLNMLNYARNAYLFTEASMGVLTSVLSFFVTSISYFYTYALVDCAVSMDKIRLKNFKHYKLEITMVVVALLSGMLGTGRTYLIKYIVFLFVVFYYLLFARGKAKIHSFTNILSNLKYLVVAVGIFFVLFQLMGILTNKTGKLAAKEMFYGYSGAAVVALDRAVKTYSYDGRFFAEESFYGLYGFLNHLGMSIPNSILHLPFVEVGEGMTTNIYTSLRTYLYDFGFTGVYIVQFLLGMVSAYMYTIIYRTNFHPIIMLLYGILMYGTAMQGIAEIILRNFMTLTNVFITIFFVFFYVITQWKFRIK